MKKWIVFIASILSLCCSVGRAGDLEDGIEAHYKGNDAQALELLRPLAQEGDAAAQFFLGRIFVKTGSVPNYQEAVRWYRLAAEQRVAAAQYSLGRMYAAGKGVAQDYQE
ncbi:MAG: sel1 repeat family protein, partial [Betaproteobacteria bacterium]